MTPVCQLLGLTWFSNLPVCHCQAQKHWMLSRWKMHHCRLLEEREAEYNAVVCLTAPTLHVRESIGHAAG